MGDAETKVMKSRTENSSYQQLFSCEIRMLERSKLNGNKQCIQIEFARIEPIYRSFSQDEFSDSVEKCSLCAMKIRRKDESGDKRSE